MNDLPQIVSFSFGQTSGFMLRRLMDMHGSAFDKKFRVIFENTGKEDDATLDFGHEIETKWGVEIIWLEYTRIPAIDIPLDAIWGWKKLCNWAEKVVAQESDHWFKAVNYYTARRENDANTPFDELLSWANVLPNIQNRMCSVQMKLRTRDRYLRSIGVAKFNSYIGIRADEADRAHEILANIDQYETPRFPLIDGGVTVADVNRFWDRHAFKLNIPNYMGNCSQCYLKRRSKLVKVAREKRSAIEWGAMWEKIFTAKATTGAVFKEGQSYEGILFEADNQMELAGLDQEAETACSCAIGGYRGNASEE